MFRDPATGTLRGPRHALLTLLLLALAVPASAQSHRTAIAVTGGWSRLGNLTPGFTTETVLNSGWTAGLQAETWLPTGRIGFRASGSVAARSDQNGDDYGVLNGDVGILGRILPPRPGRVAAPYAVLGVGGALFQGADGADPIGGGLYGPSPLKRAVAIAGLGVDLLNSSRVGLRLEAADQIVLLSLGESPESQGLPTAHNFHVTTGIQFRMGSLRPATSVEPVGPVGPEGPAGPAGAGVKPPTGDRAERTADAPRGPASPVVGGGSSAEAAQPRGDLARRDRQARRLQARVDSLEAELERARNGGASGRPAQASRDPAPTPAPTPAPAPTPTPTPARQPDAARGDRPLGQPAGSPVREAVSRPAPQATAATQPPVTPSAGAGGGRPLGQPLGAPAAATSAAPAPSARSSQPRPSASGAVRYTVQIGSLVEEPTARRWTDRLEERGLPFWMQTVTVQGQRFVRLRVGVLGSESDASSLASALMRAYGWPVSVDRIAGDERPPAGAEKATRDFLRGG